MNGVEHGAVSDMGTCAISHIHTLAILRAKGVHALRCGAVMRGKGGGCFSLKNGLGSD